MFSPGFFGIAIALIILFLVIFLLPNAEESLATSILFGDIRIFLRQICQIHSDSKGIDIRQPHVSDLKRCTDIRSVKGCTQCHALVTIQMHTQLQWLFSLASTVFQRRGNYFLQLWHPHCSSDQFHGVQFVHRDIRHFQRVLDGFSSAIQQIVTNLLEFRAADVRLVIGIVVKRVHEDGNVGVGAQDVFDLICLDHEFGHGTGMLSHVFDLAIVPLGVPHVIELLGHVIDQPGIERGSSERGVPSAPQHFERSHPLLLSVLALLAHVTEVPHHADLQRAGAHIVKQIELRLLVDPVDPEMQRRGGILVDEREDVQIRQLRGVQQRPPLVLRVKRRHRQHAVLEGSRDPVRRRDVLRVRQDHGHQLLGSEVLPVHVEAHPAPGLVVRRGELVVPLLQHGNAGVVVAPAQEDGHGGGGEVGFARHEGGGVGAVEAGAGVEEDHLFGFAFGVEVSHDFEGGVALDEGDFHVEGAEVNTEDGFGKGWGGEEGEGQAGQEGKDLHGVRGVLELDRFG
mmetsp:Transcript_28158/g.56863  ORF Transcript_28158/g.56863 Transcript_28158/m.56863 type:complete len:512 (-) Transcript_28158:198-1733(-)